MAMMVTPLPPVNSVKMALARTHTIARPPGSHPKSALAARTRRSAVFDSAST